MIYRPLDSDGDMLPVASAADLLTGPAAVLAAVNTRLRLLHGEWWEDEALGFEIPRFLFDGVKAPAGEQTLANYISSYIEATDGVLSVTGVTSEMRGRTLVYTCTILTTDGEIEGSVNADVLLPAVT